MPNAKMTYTLAHAAAIDAANRNMRKHSRLAWNEQDYKIAVNTEYTLWWKRLDVNHAIDRERSFDYA